jgi:glycopeptide antibiotics resistance protein
VKRAIPAVLLGGYVLFILDVTLLRFAHPGADWNLVPFRSMAHDLRNGGEELVVNFVGNLAVFAQQGFLLGWNLGPRGSSVRVAAICLAFSGAIELLQYASGRRVADIDDVILNVAGGLFGYLAWIGVSAAGRWRRTRVSLK